MLWHKATLGVAMTSGPDWALLLTGLAVLTVLWGVLLPAVWSSDRARRRDARKVLVFVLQWAGDLIRPRGGRR